MPDIAQQDIAYQPATKAYSFSANQAVPPPAPQPKPEPALEPEQKPKMSRKPINWKPFFLLSGEIIGLFLVFIIFLLVLNFFNIISLPVNNWNLPKQKKAIIISKYAPYQKITVFSIDGILYGYNGYTIKVKSGDQMLSFQYDPNSSSIKKEISKTIYTLSFLTELEKQTNIGKAVSVEFIKNDNQNNIINISYHN